MKKKQIIVGGLVIGMFLAVSYYIKCGKTSITVSKGNPKREEAARKIAKIFNFSIEEDENNITLLLINVKE